MSVLTAAARRSARAGTTETKKSTVRAIRYLMNGLLHTFSIHTFSIQHSAFLLLPRSLFQRNDAVCCHFAPALPRSVHPLHDDGVDRGGGPETDMRPSVVCGQITAVRAGTAPQCGFPGALDPDPRAEAEAISWRILQGHIDPMGI